MNILLVSDNRPSPNWGCRATTTALLSLLSRYGRVFDTVGNDLKKKQVTTLRFLNVWPSFLPDQAVLRILGKSIPKAAMTRLRRATSVSVADPKKGAQRFKDHSKWSEQYARVISSIRKADLVVVNGEGDFILDPNRYTQFFLLSIIEISKEMGKRVLVVNSMISDSPSAERDHEVFSAVGESLRKCDTVLLRDRQSLQIAHEMNLGNARCCPDALFLWLDCIGRYQRSIVDTPNLLFPFPYDRLAGSLSLNEPYVCIGGSSLAPTASATTLETGFIAMINGLQRHGVKPILVETCRGDAFLRRVASRTGTPFVPVEAPVAGGAALLANARLFVSGRYHPSVMATLNYVPLLCFTSNSHKMESLQELIRYDQVTHIPLDKIHATASSIVDMCMSSLEKSTATRTATEAVVSCFPKWIEKEYSDAVLGTASASLRVTANPTS